MKSSLYHLLLANLIISGCVFAKAFSQEIEQTTSTTDSYINSPSTPTNVLLGSDNNFSDGNFVLDGNDQSGASTTAIPLLNTVTEIRQYLVSKLHEIYHTLKGHQSKFDIEQATLLDLEHLPMFEDPLYIGNFTKKYKLADVSFSNVRVRGMRDFRSADVHTDSKGRTVDLQLIASSLRISGNYFLSNYFKKTSGSFVVKLVDNVTYYETSVYCRLKQEVDIAASYCGIRYGKSENDYANLGFFTQLFRGAISNPMIDQVLQRVGKEIGHKMRPVLLDKLRETVIGGDDSDNSAVVPGLETLIRSTVSETRNLMMKDEYKNFQLDGNAKKFQYGSHDGTIRNINLSSIGTFEISKLKIPILNDKIIVNLTIHDTNVEGSADITFVEDDTIELKTGTPTPTNVILPFEIQDLRVDLTLDKRLSNDAERFGITKLNVTISKIVTKPSSDRATYSSQIAFALTNFLPSELQSVISERLDSLARSHIENMLKEAALEPATSSEN